MLTIVYGLITPYVTYVVYSIVPHFQLSSQLHNSAVGHAMLKDTLIVFITGFSFHGRRKRLPSTIESDNTEMFIIASIHDSYNYVNL